MAISKSFAQGQSDPLRRLSMRLPFGRWMSMDFNGCQDSFANVFYYPSDHTALLGQGPRGTPVFTRDTFDIMLTSFKFYLSSGRTRRWQGSFTAVQLNHEAVGYQYSTRVRTRYNTPCRSSVSMAARTHLKEGYCCQSDGRWPGPSALTLSTSFGLVDTIAILNLHQVIIDMMQSSSFKKGMNLTKSSQAQRRAEEARRNMEEASLRPEEAA